ncbi:FecR family protein [Pedobacter metabolipauper]|uniref:FecR family protein n=1 Tax=Pedobacter metabolipauper TaxID=425513 RepID=A0A4V3D1I1_9SPHI|nr:FecR domain-containing protein [Pedobacter metabolipauper]TDQ11193.1 FecR family protein [Pedobacter metabolipauper]
MKNERLQYLLERYRTSKCSDQELKEINDWYEEINAGSQDLEEWIEEAGGSQFLADQLYNNFEKKRNQSRRITGIIGSRWKAAAAILLVLGSSIAFYSYLQQANPDVNAQQAKVLPGKNKAVLVLADGRQIDLDAAAIGIIDRQNGMMITKTDSGQLIYTVDQKYTAKATDKIAYHTLKVPRGGQYRIVLPDQSKVWLNAQSTLNFPVTSASTGRNVRLDGEAYFEVTPMKHQPFSVLTGNQQVQVLGTHFNVKGYPGDHEILTTLLEGRVKVSQITSAQGKILHPGQQSEVQTQSDLIAVRKVNTDQAVAWKNGYFIFDNQDIRSIMKVISRWYNVDVAFHKVSSNEHFGGTFSRNADLSEILNNLQDLGNLRFKIDQRKVVVSQLD